MKSLFKPALLFGIGTVMAASSAMGAFTFNNGDMILGFQATSGQGLTQNVFFNIGSGTGVRDGNSSYLGNISTTLASVYGLNWYSRNDVYFGVIGNLVANNAFNTVIAVNGDPAGTFYLSTPTVNPGQGLLISAGSYSQSALNGASSTLNGMESIIVGLNTEADGAAILSQSTSPVEWSNGWTAWNPTPGAAFNVFTGGIQQSLGGATSSSYVDIQRVIPRALGADPAGVVGGGVYVNTLAIGSNGDISLIPEPSSSLLAAAAAAAFAFRRRRSA